jgi:hypothetical protein
MQDLPEAVDQQWLAKAKGYTEYVKSKMSKEEARLKTVLTQVEEIAAENSESQEELSREDSEMDIL